MNNAPIGIFDSGVGGLTVARAIMDQLPYEKLVYVGDNAHLPYGDKSLEQIRRYATRVMDDLVSRGVKMLVIACNSASAAVYKFAVERYSIPVLEVVEPAARTAAAVTRNRKIGVIATSATVQARVYPEVLSAYENLDVIQQACPEFVPLVESGNTTGGRALSLAHEYLDPLSTAGVDTLILGCTHYPHLQGVISYVMGPEVALVSSSDETAKDVYRALAASDSFRDSLRGTGSHQFFTTGPSHEFAALASRFIGPQVGTVESLTRG